MLVVGLVLVGFLVLAIKKGQFDDLEGESSRVLFDEIEEKNQKS